MVLRSSALRGVGPTVFGDGLQCLAGAATRVGAAFAIGGSAVAEVGHGAGSGTYHYQLWFRNGPAGYCDPLAAFNLSSGRTLTW